MVIEQNPKNWFKRKYKHVLTMGYRYADFLLITLKRMTSWPEENTQNIRFQDIVSILIS